MLLMATCSKKILVLGWAPPDKEDVDEQDVVDGDLLQEDLLGASRHQQHLLHQHLLYQVVPNQVLRSSWSKSPSTTSSLSGGAQPSTKILVLGWAPPDKEDVDEEDVV